MLSSAVNPFCASIAATIPFLAAFPAWNGLVIVPKFCLSPPASEAAIPSATLVSETFTPIILAAAAAAPRVPRVAVECHPTA